MRNDEHETAWGGGPLIPAGSDACSAAEAAALAGLPLRSLNRLRRRLERFRDASGQWVPVPQSATRAWRRARVIVAPSLGGASQYGGDWRYSRAACLRWRREGGGDTAGDAVV